MTSSKIFNSISQTQVVDEGLEITSVREYAPLVEGLGRLVPLPRKQDAEVV